MLHDVVCQARTIEGCTECETTSHHPNHTPVHFLQVATLNHSCQCENSKWNESNGVGIDARELVCHPEQDCNDKGYDDDIGLRLFLHATIDFQFHSLLAEREHGAKNQPRDEEQNDDKREHEHHPFTETKS